MLLVVVAEIVFVGILSFGSKRATLFVIRGIRVLLTVVFDCCMGPIIVQGEFYNPVKPDDCFWSLGNDLSYWRTFISKRGYS